MGSKFVPLLGFVLLFFFSCGKSADTLTRNTVGFAKIVYMDNSDSLFPIVKTKKYDSTSFLTATSGYQYDAYLNPSDTSRSNGHLSFCINNHNKLESLIYRVESHIDSSGFSSVGAILVDGKDRKGNTVSNLSDFGVSITTNAVSGKDKNGVLNYIEVNIGKNQKLLYNVKQFSMTITE